VYFAQKRAFEPFVINLTKEDDGYYVNVVNETVGEIKGELKVEEKLFNGRVVSTIIFDVESLPYSIKKYKLPQDVRSTDYLKIELGNYKTLYLQDDQSLFNYSSNITVKKERINENSIKIKIRANEFAKCVFIDIPGVVVDITDNYFDMEKDEERTILVHSLSQLSKSDVKVLTFADVWEE
jgi:hypothetical protein